MCVRCKPFFVFLMIPSPEFYSFSLLATKPFAWMRRPLNLWRKPKVFFTFKRNERFLLVHGCEPLYWLSFWKKKNGLKNKMVWKNKIMPRTYILRSSIANKENNKSWFLHLQHVLSIFYHFLLSLSMSIQYRFCTQIDKSDMNSIYNE